MTPKTRHILIGILIGVLTTVSINVLFSGRISLPPAPKPHILIYPNSGNVVRLSQELGDTNVLFTIGTLSKQMTTFQTSDTLHKMLTYYLTAYQQEYKDYTCDDGWSDTPATNIRFNCSKSSVPDDTIMTYSVDITINATSDSIKKVWVEETLWIVPMGPK